MNQTDVSFKQSRRRRKQVEQDDEEYDIVCLLLNGADRNASSIVGSKSSSPATATMATRKPGLVRQSTAARKEWDALLKFYEVIDNTTDVITPEGTSNPEAVMPGASRAAQSCWYQSDPLSMLDSSPALSASSQVGSGSNMGATLRHSLLSRATASRPLWEDASMQSPGHTAISISPTHYRSGMTHHVPEKNNSVTTCVREDDALNSRVVTDAMPMVHAQALTAESSGGVITEHKPESQRTPPLEKSVTGAEAEKHHTNRCEPPLAAPLMSCTAGSETVQRHNPVDSSTCYASPLQAAKDVRSITSSGITHSGNDNLPEDDFPIPSQQGNVIQLDSTPTLSLADTAVGLPSAGHVDMSVSMHASAMLYSMSQTGQSGHRTDGRSMECSKHSCVTPRLSDVTADTESEKAASSSQSLRVSDGILQPVVFGTSTSPLAGPVSEASAAALSGAAALTSHPVHSVSADEVFSTPRLTLPHGLPSSDEQRQPITAHPVNSNKSMSNAQPEHDNSAEGCLAAEQAVQARVSHVPYTPSHSQVSSQQRCAKARASVSYSEHSGLPRTDHPTPYSGRVSRGVMADARASMSMRGSTAAWRASQLVLSDIHRSPGLSLVQTIPEADASGSDQEVLSAHSGSPEPLTAVEQVLVACGQDCVGDFTEVMQQRYAGSRVRKLGEGSFKEVFLCDSDVVSVIPIEGDIVINDLKQPTALKILPELVAHKELSALRQPTAPHADPAGATSLCSGFVNVMGCMLLKGAYYMPLAKAWRKFKKTSNDAENDDPTGLPEDQLFLILITENGGKPLEDILMGSFEEAKSIILQVSQENDLQRFQLNGQGYKVKSHGRKACLIDFTLCRLRSPQGLVLASRLDELDWEWLFTETTGNQGDAYLGMKQVAEQTWKSLEFPDMRWDNYTPGTNVVWIAYLCEQLRENVVVKDKSGELWKAAMTKKEKQSWDAFRHDVACVACKSSANLGHTRAAYVSLFMQEGVLFRQVFH